MNILTPVSHLMSTELITVNAKDTLTRVKEIFDTDNIHHLPVVDFKKIIGLISKTDLLYFLKGAKNLSEAEEQENAVSLSFHTAKDIMVTKLAKLTPSDTVGTAIAVFQENLFHALPVVDEEELVGILTTYDLLNFFSQERVQLSDYQIQA
ncbi:MAG: CBS domain-containing protein [Bacteroidota bacterium]